MHLASLRGISGITIPGLKRDNEATAAIFVSYKPYPFFLYIIIWAGHLYTLTIEFGSF